MDATKEYRSARQLLSSGEEALCIFTDGAHLEIGSDGKASSGWWVLSAHKKNDRVIIYKTTEGQAQSDIYFGRWVGVEGPREGHGDDRDRYLVRMRETRLVGWTIVPWKEFASAGQNPIRYLTGELK